MPEDDQSAPVQAQEICQPVHQEEQGISPETLAKKAASPRYFRKPELLAKHLRVPVDALKEALRNQNVRTRLGEIREGMLETELPDKYELMKLLANIMNDKREDAETRLKAITAYSRILPSCSAPASKTEINDNSKTVNYFAAPQDKKSVEASDVLMLPIADEINGRRLAKPRSELTPEELALRDKNNERLRRWRNKRKKQALEAKMKQMKKEAASNAADTATGA